MRTPNRTRRSCRHLLVLIGLLVGCHPLERLPAPDVEGVSAALLIVRDADSSAIYGVEVTAEGPEWPSLALRGDATLRVLMFSCGLERLGLEPGRQPYVEDANAAGRLPEPMRELRLPEGGQAWQPAPARDDVAQELLRHLPLEEGIACRARKAQFEAVATALPSDGHNLAAFATPLADGRVLVASREGFFYRIDEEGRVETLPRLVESPRSGLARGDGTVYILDAEGSLHRGRIDGAFEVIDRSPEVFAGADVSAMDGPVDPTLPLELFVTTGQSAFHVFDGTTWSTIATTAPTDTPLLKVTWLGPGRAMAPGYGPGSRGVLVYEAGQYEVRTPPEGTAVGFSARDDMLLVGTDAGRVYRYGAEWSRLPGVGFRGFAHVLRPLDRGGWLIGGVTDFFPFEFGFGQWFPDLGYCPPERLSSPVAVTAPLGDHAWLLLTVTSITTTEAFDVAVIRQTAPPAGCSGP